MGFLQYLIDELQGANPKNVFQLFAILFFFFVSLFISVIWGKRMRKKLDDEKEAKENQIKDLVQRVTELESKVGNN